ncbi:ankyrin repeat domain-containing protein 6 [Pseudochaenichthys georgianus]|uniref:ankyrin repeat domain-containing protein 6 n=1 Tax=Pseudochaenichthys georgianus TaxID=52239 RepID=UPI00146A3D09|nr:ankyrin repeat domain-containing protein 6 [Pseudochaenichthys georgianus]
MSEQALVHMPQRTTLHRAAMVGNRDSVAALIQGGCALDLQDKDGNTALHEASWHGFSHCVKLLVKAGADVNIRNKAGNTALHLSCQNAHAQTTRLLLLGGSTPDTKNNAGDTCLHVAARYNNLTLAKTLLSSLCSVTQRNQVGDTALHVVAALNHKKMVQLLLEAGTDGKARNNSGKTALDKARDNNHKDVAHLLARAPQVHRFMRGRTIRKRRERLTAERRSQSFTREETLANKDSSSLEDSPSSDQTESRTALRGGSCQQQKLQKYYNKTFAPTSSPPSQRKRRGKEQAVNENEVKKSENNPKKNLLWDEAEDFVQNGKVYQLYTLYRDKDGNIKQTQASGCHCKPLLEKLEGQLTETQEEMRLHILNVQEQVNRRLSKMDHRNRHQMKVLDLLSEQRAAAERRRTGFRIEQRAAQGREEALTTQAAVSHELKRWCVSQLKDMDAPLPARGQYYHLLPSQSVEQCAADADLESVPLLSVLSGDSSTSLATYVNILPSRSSFSVGGPEPDMVGGKTYFQMKVDSSPDDYENTTLFPLPASSSSRLLLASGDPLWQLPGGQDSPITAVVPMCGGGFSSSTSQSSLSTPAPPLTQHQLYNTHFPEVCVQKRAGVPTECTTTLEFFFDRPPEPTFTQERNSQNAMEVTQRFFETVSVQLERWYERKVAQVEQQTELSARQDKRELLQRINALEEELERLKTNENADS